MKDRRFESEHSACMALNVIHFDRGVTLVIVTSVIHLKIMERASMLSR